MKKLNGQTITLLKRPLNPAYISHYQKGDYISTSRIIKLANHIFGFGNWSAKTLSYQQEHLDSRETPKGIRFYATYSALVEVRIHATNATYSDVGTKTGVGKTPDEAIELAIKACRSIALKRALRHLGDQFGLSLYKESDIKEIENISTEEEEYLYDENLKEFNYYLNEVMMEYGKKANKAKKNSDDKALREANKKIEEIEVWSKKEKTTSKLNIKKNILILKSVLGKLQGGEK